ncbi:MAG: FecR domain-containing protein [Cyclobacteriaceae bacterium]
MDYKHHRVEDFVLDETFRKWVLDNDKESRLFWNQWLEDHPHKAETVAKAIELLKQLPVQQDSMNEQEKLSIMQAIEDGIDQWEATVQNPPKQEKVTPISAYAMAQQKLRVSLPKKHRVGSWVLKVAACIIFCIGMIYVAYQVSPHENVQHGVAYELVVKENPMGQKLTVFLADGSRVMLNAGSKISFLKPFQPNQRIVTLEGEAFFEVVKDSLRPFRVISGALTTTALGTSFNIMANPQDDRIQVSLTSGKVKVDYQATTTEHKPEVNFLLPGEQLAYEKEGHVLTKHRFEADKVLAWKEGVIYLENADQATVVRTLERWYGIQIEVTGHSSTIWDITARFNNQSLKSVLTSLSYTMNFDFEIKEDHILIKYSASI